MTATKITDLDLLVLGLIAEMPRHAYDLERELDERGMREWTEIGFSSVYYVCNKLNKLGLVEAEKPASAKARKRYTLAAKGSEVLTIHSLNALREHRPNNSSVLLGMIHWPFLDPEQAIVALCERQQLIVEERKRLEHVRIQRQPLPDFVDSVFEFSLGQLVAEAAWTAKTIAYMEQKLEGQRKRQMAHDLTREEINELYKPPTDKVVEVDVPALNYLVIDGDGDPAGIHFQQATKWLFATIVPLRKIAKEKLGSDFVEPPLEALYWTVGEANLDTAPKSDWHWRCMIVLAGWMDESMVADAIGNAGEVLGKVPDSLRVDRMHEGRCVQIMHRGSPDDERGITAKIYNEYLPSHNLTPNGPYHEIYLGDATRVAPEKMRTIVRQPVAHN